MKAVAVGLACATLFGSATLVPERQPQRTTGTREPVRLVLIVLDGGRPDYLSVSGIPHLRALQRSGTTFTSAWAGILESVTPAGHASLSSGSEPQATGILGFGWPDASGRWVSLYHEDAVRAGLLDRLMRQARVPTIAQRVHDVTPRARVVALGGYKFYANDALGGPDADVVMYYADTPDGRFTPHFIPGHPPPPGVLRAGDASASIPWSHLPLGEGNHLAMRLAVDTMKMMHQRVTLINLPEFDMPLGHILGANRDRRDVRRLMRGFDRDLGGLERVLQRQGALSHTLFVITADHGFAPIDHSIPETVIRNAVQRAGTEVVHSVLQTGLYLWLRNPERAAPAGRQLMYTVGKRWIGAVYARRPHGARGYVRASPPVTAVNSSPDAADRYLLRSFMGPQAPDVVVFLKEGVAAHLAGRRPWRGDHGGADWESQHIPLVISGPGVRRNAVVHDPVRIIDIAPTSLTLMGVPATGMQGIPAASAFDQPDPAMLRSWEQVTKETSPLIAGLRREATRERRSSRQFVLG
jgi:arylsulfatase A-like enzyme